MNIQIKVTEPDGRVAYLHIGDPDTFTITDAEAIVGTYPNGTDFEPVEDEQLEDMPLQKLVLEFDRLQHEIDQSDGRLTSGSSAQLDYDQDCQEDVAREIIKRLGVERRFAEFLHLADDRYAPKKRTRDGFNVGYFHVDSLRVWRQVWWTKIRCIVEDMTGTGPSPYSRPRGIFGLSDLAGVFKNRNGVVPGRWGVYVLGFEFGSRNPDDPLGCWLKDKGLWPW